MSWIEVINDRMYWTRYNECGVCWHGKCMCHLIQPARNKLVPAGQDDHMAVIKPSEET